MYECEIRSIPSDLDERWFAEQIAECQAGDETALRRLWERYLATVHDLAKEICGRWNADDILLDAVQEGNAVLIEALVQFHGDSSEGFSRTLSAAAQRRIYQYLTGAMLGRQPRADAGGMG
jgi:DNA-directed RNA polymerase specialized sigma subunit